MALKLPMLLQVKALSCCLNNGCATKGLQGSQERTSGKDGTNWVYIAWQCKLQLGESVSVYLHDLKQLLDQALPDLEANARKQIVLYQFMWELTSNISAQLRVIGDMKEFETTIEKARLLLVTGDQTSPPVAAVKMELCEVQQL